MEDNGQELSRVISDGGEAERLLAHPLIDGFFTKEIEDVFNAFCTMRPGAPYETYLRLHMEAFSLISLKSKLTEYVTEKATALFRERFEIDTES